jgi:hypothetical protein
MQCDPSKTLAAQAWEALAQVCWWCTRCRVSDYLNAITAAGLRIEAADEPAATDAFRRFSSEKAAWMDRYVGIFVLRALLY